LLFDVSAASQGETPNILVLNTCGVNNPHGAVNAHNCAIHVLM